MIFEIWMSHWSPRCQPMHGTAYKEKFIPRWSTTTPLGTFPKVLTYTLNNQWKHATINIDFSIIYKYSLENKLQRNSNPMRPLWMMDTATKSPKRAHIVQCINVWIKKACPYLLALFLVVCQALYMLGAITYRIPTSFAVISDWNHKINAMLSPKLEE